MSWSNGRDDFDAFMDFAEKYRGKEFTGRIHWFDGSSGKGMVTLDDGTSLYCHFTAIAGVDKNNYSWPTEADRARLDKIGGRRCKVVPYITPGYVGCELVTLLD